jgi:hypothetical protein
MINSAQLPQLRVLLIRDVDIVDASAPGTHATLETVHVLRVAADNERAQTIQGSEVVITGWETDGSLAISFHEANPPQASIAVKVEQDARHGRIVGRLPCAGEFSSCGLRFEPKGLCFRATHPNPTKTEASAQLFSQGSDFNFDFSASYTREQQHEGIEYNFDSEPALRWRRGQEGGGEGAEAQFAAMCGIDAPEYARNRPGMSAFVFEDGAVYHAYSIYARAALTPYGL